MRKHTHMYIHTSLLCILPTITICCSSINHHKPTTLYFHGNIFEYVVAWSFTYTLVSTPFLPRNVPIKRYLHLGTATHKFVVIYSLSWMHCTAPVVPPLCMVQVCGLILLKCTVLHSLDPRPSFRFYNG